MGRRAWEPDSPGAIGGPRLAGLIPGSLVSPARTVDCALVNQDDSIELDRRRSVGEILRLALDLYRDYPWLFLILAAAVMAPYDLAILAVVGRGPLARAHESFAVNTLLSVLNFSLIGPLISALHVHALVLIGEGRRPRLGRVALSGLRVLPVVSAAEIVANVGIFAGFLALIIPGVLLALRWSVVAQAAAVEHEGWLPALRRSRQLTEGHYSHIIGLVFVTGALSFVVRFGTAAIPVGSSSGVASVTLGIAIDTIRASFVALTLAVLYFDLIARAAEPPARSTPEYQHLRDLD